MHWLTVHWERLRAGAKIELAFDAHPSAHGFRRIRFADRVGQLEDWALSLADGSRLHLWLMPDGRWILHRDAIDPARGLLQAAMHIMTESRAGKLVLVTAMAIGFGTLLVRGVSA